MMSACAYRACSPGTCQHQLFAISFSLPLSTRVSKQGSFLAWNGQQRRLWRVKGDERSRLGRVRAGRGGVAPCCWRGGTSDQQQRVCQRAKPQATQKGALTAGKGGPARPDTPASAPRRPRRQAAGAAASVLREPGSPATGKVIMPPPMHVPRMCMLLHHMPIIAVRHPGCFQTKPQAFQLPWC